MKLRALALGVAGLRGRGRGASGLRALARGSVAAAVAASLLAGCGQPP